MRRRTRATRICSSCRMGAASLPDRPDQAEPQRTTARRAGADMPRRDPRPRRAARLAPVFVTIALTVAPVFAQWEGYPTPGIPRLPDGKPNLAAPAPKGPDGHPDLSGIWLASRAIFDLRQAMK